MDNSNWASLYRTTNHLSNCLRSAERLHSTEVKLMPNLSPKVQRGIPACFPVVRLCLRLKSVYKQFASKEYFVNLADASLIGRLLLRTLFQAQATNGQHGAGLFPRQCYDTGPSAYDVRQLGLVLPRDTMRWAYCLDKSRHLGIL